MGKPGWVGWVALPLIGLTGCFAPSPEGLARLAETQRAGEELTASVEHLEERFLGNQANLLLWDELARRSQQVTAIACNNHGKHFEAMVEALDKQEEKARQLRRRRVAQAKGSDDATVLSAAAAPRRGGKARN